MLTYHASAAAATASKKIPIDAMRRRSKRSASVPVSSTSTSDGRNSTRPRMPRSISRPVRSKTVLPSTVVSASAPIDENACVVRNVQTEPRVAGTGRPEVDWSIAPHRNPGPLRASPETATLLAKFVHAEGLGVAMDCRTRTRNALRAVGDSSVLRGHGFGCVRGAHGRPAVAARHAGDGQSHRHACRRRHAHSARGNPPARRLPKWSAGHRVGRSRGHAVRRARRTRRREREHVARSHRVHGVRRPSRRAHISVPERRGARRGHPRQ